MSTIPTSSSSSSSYQQPNQPPSNSHSPKPKTPLNPLYNNPNILAYPNLPSPTSSELESLNYLLGLLGRILRITLIDDRIMQGYLGSIDKSQNIVLTDTEEFQPLSHIIFEGSDTQEILKEKEEEAQLKERRERRMIEEFWPKSLPSRADGGWGGRELALVLIKGKYIKKVELIENEEEAMSIRDEREGKIVEGLVDDMIQEIDEDQSD